MNKVKVRPAGITIAIVVQLIFLMSAPFFGRTKPSADDIDARVDSILSQMTLEEKIDMLGGVDGFFIRGLPRLGLPRLKMADGPLGVRNFGPATAMAGGIALAATWNPDLAERVGTQIGRDARAKGVNFLLGPGVNIYRAPMNGRNFEYLGEDPFLGSRIAVGYIDGVQSQGVSATIKHFMANNSEFNRHNVDSVIDERALREIYLPIFESAVKEAHVGAIMDSYNLTNGRHMTQNGYLNTDVVKNEWGFKGIVMSDWTATYDAVAAANGGLDLEMPSGDHLNRQLLLPAIKDGKVSVATIDDKVRRILRTAIGFGWFDRDQTDLAIPRYNQEGRAAALEAAREGMVLLKNEGGLLPLAKGKVKSIAVIGPDAYPAVPVGGGSAHVEPFAAVSFLEGLSNSLGTAAKVYYSPGLPTLAEMAARSSFVTAPGGSPGLHAEYFENQSLEGQPVTAGTDQQINFGQGSFQSMPANARSERWTGYYDATKTEPVDVFVESTGEDGGYYRLSIDDKIVFDNWDISKAIVASTTMQLNPGPHKVVLEHHGRSQWLGSRLRFGMLPAAALVAPEAKEIAAKADAVVIAAGFAPETESEGADRTFGLPPGQDELIQEIASANRNTVVVITSGGSVGMSDWLDRVPALIEAWYPGQEGGRALADILLGDANPSGRLPVTFERRWEDNPVHDSYYPAEGSNRVEYKEGIFVGYRGYEHNGVKPLFPFGFGLSYTTFGYRNLSVKPAGRSAYTVAFDVTNTGKREGSDVVEVYVSDAHATVPRPPKELRGFQKVKLEPGQTRRVSVTLNGRSFAYYDVQAKAWRIDPGEFDILVGSSSDNIALKAKVSISESSVAN